MRRKRRLNSLSADLVSALPDCCAWSAQLCEKGERKAQVQMRRLREEASGTTATSQTADASYNFSLIDETTL